MLEVDFVVGFLGILAINCEFGGIDVENEIDAGLRESVHALIVVQGVVNGIYGSECQQFIIDMNVSIAMFNIQTRMALIPSSLNNSISRKQESKARGSLSLEVPPGW